MNYNIPNNNTSILLVPLNSIDELLISNISFIGSDSV